MDSNEVLDNECSLAPENLLTTGQAARLLDKAPGTLANWRAEGKGPPFVKYEGSVYYLKNELETYKKRTFLHFRSTKEWKEHKMQKQ